MAWSSVYEACSGWTQVGGSFQGPPGDCARAELNLAASVHARPMRLEGLPCVRARGGNGLRWRGWDWAEVRRVCAPEALGHLLAPRCAGPGTCQPPGLGRHSAAVLALPRAPFL